MIKTADKLLWSKQPQGNVVYLGTFSKQDVFRTVCGIEFNVTDIALKSQNMWVDDISTEISVAPYSCTKEAIIAKQNHYSPFLKFAGVVQHVDFSTVTSECSEHSYYLRMGVPFKCSINSFEWLYGLNTIDVVKPIAPIMYLNTLDKFCDKLVGNSDCGKVVLLERGVGLLANDTTAYAINTLLVLFENSSQRENFNNKVKNELGIILPEIKDKPLLFI